MGCTSGPLRHLGLTHLLSLSPPFLPPSSLPIAMRYFEVEERLADVSPDCLVLTAERAKPLIDENTIGVCPILGSTFNGEFEDVQGRATEGEGEG